MKVLLKGINHVQETSKKDGKTRDFTKILVFWRDSGIDVWFKGFTDNMAKTWETGDEVDVDLEQNGQYFNWKKNDNTKPSPDRKMELLKSINFKLDILLGKAGIKQDEVKNEQRKVEEVVNEAASTFNGTVEDNGENFDNMEPKDDDIKVEDIPF